MMLRARGARYDVEWRASVMSASYDASSWRYTTRAVARATQHYAHRRAAPRSVMSASDIAALFARAMRDGGAAQ